MRISATVLTEVGLLAYLLTIPLGRELGPGTRDALLLLVLVGLVLRRLPWRGAGPPAAPFGLLGPVLLFFGSTALAVLASEHPELSRERAAFAPVALVLFLAVQDVVSDARAHRRLLEILGVVLGVIGLDGLSQYATGASLLSGQPPHGGPGGRIEASLPNPNDLGMIPLLLPLVLHAGVAEFRSWRGRLLLVGLPGAMATAVLSGSRNVWLGLGAGLASLALQRPYRRVAALATAVAAACMLAAVLLGAVLAPVETRPFLEFRQDPRIGQWLVAWQLFREAPWLGKGAHSFGEYYQTYLERVALPAGYLPEEVRSPWPHCLYLEILAERGLVGALGFGALIGAMALRVRRTLIGTASPPARGLPAALSASLLAFLVQAAVELTFLKDWVLLELLLLAALVGRLPREADRVP